MATFIATTLGAIKALQTYRLNKKRRNVEADVKLLSHFNELLDIAYGRRKADLSDKTIKRLFSEGVITDSDKSNAKALKNKQNEVDPYVMPVGSAIQDAAIASIGDLGLKHNILRDPAMHALKELKEWKPIAQVYFDKLK